MMELKLLHAADLHLGSSFQTLGEKGALRRAEMRTLPSRLATLCREKDADLLLLSGDVFDRPDAPAGMARELFSALSETGCPVFIAPGNHDFYHPGSPYARVEAPENVHIFRSETPECVCLEELGAEVWGRAFVSPDSVPPLRSFRPEKTGRLSVGVFHGDTASAGSPYGAVTYEDIAACGLDYLALGHIHTPSPLRRAGSTFFAYPGCAMGRGFDECGDRGALFVRLGDGVCRSELVSLGAGRFETLSLGYVRGFEQLLPEHTENDVFRLTLTGEADRPPDTGLIKKALEHRFFDLEVVDETVPRRDIWQGAGGDTLRGVFLRRMKALYDDAPEEERDVILLAAQWGLASLDGGEAVREI